MVGPCSIQGDSKSCSPKDHIKRLRPLLSKKYSPLRSNGNGLQSVYLAVLTQDLAAEIISVLGKGYDKAIGKLANLVGSSAENALEEAIKGRTDIGATTKTQLVLARRGQGIFKDNVRQNEKGCRVTGVSDSKHLRASHIKPWSQSTDEEKLDGCNGILLAPHVDHLFDRGFISFANDGDILIAKDLDANLLRAWGLENKTNVGKFNERQRVFLDFHRQNVFKK
jgi:putative restriction endonuclease